MKKKLGLAAGTAVVGGIMLAMGINTIDSQPDFVEPTPVSTTTKSAKPTTVKPTKTKAPEISETTNSPKPKKTTAPRSTPSPTKTPVDLGAEPTVRTRYPNCTELRKDFPKGVPSNHPAYEKKFDRDNDGFGCEVD